MNGIAAALVRECTGITPTGNLRHLEEDLWPMLAEHQGVIVVDETQRLNHEALEYLRHLHDDPRTNFGMLLIGGYGCWEVIARYPMLESRILVRVRFEPLTVKETLRAMPGYHRIYQTADMELLARIHNECTHGVFRAWAAFTVIAVDLCERLGLETVTEEVAEAAFELLGRGGR
jgi:DNA transposition AAA+ family ATPase